MIKTVYIKIKKMLHIILGPNTRLCGLIISEVISFTLCSLSFIFFNLGNHLSFSWISDFFQEYLSNIEIDIQTGSFSNITEQQTYTLLLLNNNFLIFQKLLLTVFVVYVCSKIIVLILFI